MERDAKIYVAGHSGLGGSAIVRALEGRGRRDLLLRSSAELDLTAQDQVRAFFQTARPDYVFMAAGRSGGILANRTYPAEFIYTNLAIQINVIHAAWEAGVTKLLFIGCSCVYPREAAQPIHESSMLTGPVEPTSEPFAIAKIAGITMCQSYRAQYGVDFISMVPATLYGPGDNFDPETSHFLSAFIRRFHEAKLADAPEVSLWGTGTPERELLYVDDFAEACLFLMDSYSKPDHVNAGFGEGVTIREAAETVKEIVGYQGRIALDPTKPDGAPRKVLDSQGIHALGWTPKTVLADGLRATYDWYREHAV